MSAASPEHTARNSGADTESSASSSVTKVTALPVDIVEWATSNAAPHKSTLIVRRDGRCVGWVQLQPRGLQ